jgi:hypothetical protein
MIPTLLFSPQQVAKNSVRRIDMAQIGDRYLQADGFTPNAVFI